GRGEELAVLEPRLARGAGGAAEHAGRAHAHVEDALVVRVAPEQRVVVAAGRVLPHADECRATGPPAPPGTGRLFQVRARRAATVVARPDPPRERGAQPFCAAASLSRRTARGPTPCSARSSSSGRATASLRVVMPAASKARVAGLPMLRGSASGPVGASPRAAARRNATCSGGALLRHAFSRR